MNIIYLIIGLVIGFGVGWVVKPMPKQTENGGADFASEDEKKKAENFEKIQSYIADKDKFTNDDLQNLIKVSDTTIGRYLDELEHQGKIKQVGKTGRFVYYTK